MGKQKQQKNILANEVQIDENALFAHVAEIIEVRKHRARASHRVRRVSTGQSHRLLRLFCKKNKV